MKVGIDLGTTYSVVAWVDPATGKASVIKNGEGGVTIPSVLYFSPEGPVLHGDEAKVYVEEGSENTANYFKYHMGDPDWKIFRNGREYTAEDLSALFLRRLVDDASDTLGQTIDEAVITVPAYFDHVKRQATMRAGEKAGLKVLNIISEPTAAAFAYGINGKSEMQTVLVYDLGGGTFDVTIARITEDNIQVLGTDGDHQLGGKDWDDALSDYLSEQFEEEFGITFDNDVSMNITMQMLAETAKKNLTSKNAHSVTINYGGKRGVYEITEDLFEAITAYNLNRTKDIMEKLMDELSMSWSDIDGVLLVGGSTRMKQVKKYLTMMCKKEPMSGVNVDEAVAIGAAIRANIDIQGKIQGKIGPSARQGFLGAAQNSSSGRLPGAKAIQDATAHSMGMIAVNSDMTRYINSIMIKKNAPIPSKVTKPYELGVGKMEENNLLEVYMIQGEEEELRYPLNCTVVGKYVFTGIQYRESRKEIIDVTYSYDENNIVQVEAVQRSTDSSLALHIESVEEDMSWVLDDPKKRAANHSIQPEVGIYFAIDLSGSMSGQGLEKSQKAALSFIGQFDMKYTEIGLINFSDRCVLYQKLTDNRAVLQKKIKSWKINDDNLGYGNAAHPFTLAYDLFRKNKEFDVQYLLVLTDGYWSCEEAAIVAAKKCHSAGIEVIALGFAGANQQFLNRIASRADFASFTELSSLETVLTGIAKIM